MTFDGATLLAFFRAMANENRLKIVGLLSGEERSVQELAGLLGLKEPTVSHHLAMLKELGLVTARVDGNTHWHALDLDVLRAMNRTLLDTKNVAALGTAKPKAEPDNKVLATFVDEEGKLKSIPASRKKRFVVLRWLVSQFDDDRRYKESELNKIIQRHHWDSATLRREMIGAKMMSRNAGVYWRNPQAEWQSFEND